MRLKRAMAFVVVMVFMLINIIPASAVATTPAPTQSTTPQASLDASGILKSPYYPEDLVVVEYPRTVAEFENAIMTVLASGKLDYTINYPDSYDTFTESSAKYNFNQACGRLYNTQIELFSFYDLINCKIDGTATGTALTIELRNGGISAPVELLKMQNAYMEDAKKVIEDLIKDGKITATMTEKEKAAVLFEWVCKNVTYDEDTALKNAKATGLSYTGYGALKNKKAVCQGYTALYNLLCRYVGIRVQSVPGTAGGLHIWTAAILDGERVWIDVTFGDALGDIGIAWYNFAAPMNESNFVGTHKWDKEKYSEWK